MDQAVDLSPPPCSDSSPSGGSAQPKVSCRVKHVHCFDDRQRNAKAIRVRVCLVGWVTARGVGWVGTDKADNTKTLFLVNGIVRARLHKCHWASLGLQPECCRVPRLHLAGHTEGVIESRALASFEAVTPPPTRPSFQQIHLKQQWKLLLFARFTSN